MDNLTHSLVGAALAETGLKRLTPLALPTMVVAANFPDIDIVTGLVSTRDYLEYHRGITHALVAIPLLSVLLGAGVHGFAKLIPSLRSQKTRLLPLIIVSFIAMITHPLLDFTNSYGWRPYLPWSNAWHYGDIAFVVDPWIWAGLGGALLLCYARNRTHMGAGTAVFGVLALPVMLFPAVPATVRIVWFLLVVSILLAGFIIPKRPGRLLVSFSLIGLALYLGGLVLAHDNALAQAYGKAREVIGASESLQTVDALAVPAVPTHWGAVLTTDQNYYVGELDLRSSLITGQKKYPKETGDPKAIAKARQEPEIASFLRFARYPILLATAGPNGRIKVEAYDARFPPDANRPGAAFRTGVEFDAQMNRILER